MDKNVYVLNCESSLELKEITNKNTRWGRIIGSVCSVKEFDSLKKTDKDCLCVIPNKDKYKKIFNDKYMEFFDYITFDFLEKKIVIVYGNCHTSGVIDALNKYKPFRLQHSIYPIKQIHTIKDKAYFRHPVFSFCDIFIHQSIQVNNRYGREFASEEIIRILKKDCIVISFPNVYRLPKCFFPQLYEGQELKKRGGKTVFFRDKIIDENYATGVSVKNIAKIYRNDTYFDKKFLLNEFSKFIEKIRYREMDWTIKVSDFILNNFKNHDLFSDPNHPTAYFIKHIAKEIALILIGNINDSEFDDIKVLDMDSYEMPICSSVVDNYGLQYTKTLIRENGQKVRNVPMDLEEYILQYVSMEWSNPDMNLHLKFKSVLVWIGLKITNIPYRLKRKYKTFKNTII